MDIEKLTANLGSAKRQNKNGVDYWVAPMTMLREGVLNGSRGPLFYPASEIKKVVDPWNGIPLTNGHPPVSARSPAIDAEYRLGTVYNSSFSGNALKGEAWFEADRVQRIEPRILNMLETGEKIEVSTGLFTKNSDEPGEHEGRTYNGTASNYRPDHLAILVDVPGACSIADGCGVNNALSHDQVREMLRQAVRTGTSGYVWIVDVFPKYFIYERENKYYHQPYSVTAKDVQLKGDPEEVTKVVTWKKLKTKKKGASILKTLGTKPMKNMEDGGIIAKNNRVSELVTNCGGNASCGCQKKTSIRKALSTNS